jgi:hypothetical protein
MTRNSISLLLVGGVIATFGVLIFELSASPRVTSSASCTVSGTELSPNGTSRPSFVQCDGLNFRVGWRSGLRDVEAYLKDPVHCTVYRHFGRFTKDELRAKDWVSDCKMD